MLVTICPENCVAHCRCLDACPLFPCWGSTRKGIPWVDSPDLSEAFVGEYHRPIVKATLPVLAVVYVEAVPALQFSMMEEYASHAGITDEVVQ